MDEVRPGGRNRLLESAEDTIKHAAWGTLLGGVAGALGAGRFRGASAHKFAEDLPKLAEGINAAARALPTSLIDQFTADEKSPTPVIDPVMSKLSTNVTAFTQAELKRLSAAMENGTLTDTINSMLQNSDFARRMGVQ